MQGLVILIITIIIISAVVGAIAQFLNKLNELNAQPARRPQGAARGDAAARQADRDMDRFLAEIDRLRKKNAEAGGQAEPQPRQQGNGAATGRPTARPVSPPPKSDRERDREQREREREQRQRDRERERGHDRPRPRVVAEPAEPPSRRGESPVFAGPPQAPPAPPAPSRVEELPIATVVAPATATGGHATRVTHLPQRARPAPKTDLAKNLSTLFGSGQGVAIAIIMQEVLGPPKCRK